MIEEITFKILELFKQRLDAAEIIAKIKSERDKSIRDVERERALISKAISYAEKIGLPKEYADSLVKELIRLTVKLEEETVKK
ncbi:MAG: chorismate mutase [Candidatus Odinarchaeum yellowstonii]|uniref:Chorismate mutase n=1 Tax=Odinarchaeota yellowstonii (strain LCB_4) TaxID=1841599 RepID=A0AAF0D3L8_ODILC|nr:MAG: chorismate mutase [Candidatus Odinarchaeum yellowstonii]